MATYQDIKGLKVKYLSADPSTLVGGEVWYNSTTGTLKGVVLAESWYSSAANVTPRTVIGCGGGTQTNAIISSTTGTDSPTCLLAESYNGTGWTSETAVPTALGYSTGTGASAEAYVQLGGGYPSRTGTALDYDGSSWTSGTAIPGGAPGYIEGGACGPAPTALFAGGNNGDSTTWERSGGSWTAGGAMNQGVYAPTMVGTPTAAISMGGLTYPGGYRDYNQSYNGTAWAAETVLPTIRGYAGGAGIQTNAILFGGNSPGPAAVVTSLKWDGSSWTSGASLATARNSLANIGSTVGTAVAIPGSSPTAGTEEYNQTINTITAAAWASGNNMVGTAREHIGGAGSSTSGLAFGGEGPSNYDETEEWDGTSWTAGGVWPSKDESIMGCGISGTAALGFGGIGSAPGGPPVVRVTTSATYDGSSWTATNSLPVAKRAGQGFGTTAAAVCAGGDVDPSTAQTTVEEWDGTNWTAATVLPAAKGNMGGGTGTETAGVVFGGTTGTSYEYDGSSWTSGGTMMTARNQVNGFGGPAGQTASMCAGGNDGSATGETEGYDGTSWSTRPSLGTARQGSANGIGTSQTAGIQAGGSTGSYTLATEEFTGETSVATASTLTTS